MPSALRVLGDAARPKAERNAAVVAKHILRNKLQLINARDVRRSLKATIKDSADMEAALAELQDAGWVRPAPSRAGGSAGRQSKNFDVNPAVHGAAHG